MELKTIIAIVNIVYLLSKLTDGTLSAYLEWWLGKENVYEEYEEQTYNQYEQEQHPQEQPYQDKETQAPEIPTNIMEHITELNKQIALLKEENTNIINMYCRLSDKYFTLQENMITLKVYTEKEIELIKQKTYKNIFEVGKYSPYITEPPIIVKNK